MKRIFNFHIALTVTAVTGFVGLALLTIPAPASAEEANIKSNLCGGAKLSVSESKCYTDVNKNGHIDEDERNTQDKQLESSLNNVIETIINLLSVIIGIIAVIMIIIGGAKFITAGGDSGKVSSAKTTVLYAIVGLIIVALAQVIVRFVLSQTT